MTIDETLPETVKKFLKAGAVLQEIRLHEDGRWTHEGLAFENERVIDLFSRSVDRTEGGTWVLEIGRYTYPIVVERTGFFVTKVRLETHNIICELSDDSEEMLVGSTLTYEHDGKLFCRIKNGKFEARFARHAYYAMADFFEERPDGIAFVGISGTENVPLISGI